MKKLLIANVAVIGLLLATPQRASADVVYACVNPTTGLFQAVAATTNCPATWIKINWNATAGSQASNVLYTTMGSSSSGANAVSCSYVNVSAQTRTVHAELFDFQGVQKGQSTAVVEPGNGAGTNGQNGSFLDSFFYCKFTVTDGTSNDIRASLLMCPPASSPPSPPASVGACSGIPAQ